MIEVTAGRPVRLTFDRRAFLHDGRVSAIGVNAAAGFRTTVEFTPKTPGHTQSSRVSAGHAAQAVVAR